MGNSSFSEALRPQQALVLLSCHSLEDFPTHLNSEDASAVLTGWSVIWHPQIIAWTGKMPQWARADSPPEDLDHSIVIVPKPSESTLPIGTAERAVAAEHCLLITVDGQNRDEIRGQILEGDDDHRVGDFYALAYAYLQVQLMTRQLRYSSNLDETFFEEQVVLAAKAWVDGNDQAIRDALHTCFDLLAQERDHSFSADPYLIDLTLLADSTLGEELTEALQSDRPTNLLANLSLLRQLASDNPEAFESLRQRLADGTIGLAGGLIDDKVSLDMQSLTTAIGILSEARLQYIDLLGRQPHAFGRFSGGLPADLPMLISGLEYQGAIFADFVSGTDVAQDEAKLMWQCGDTEIAAICSTPMDAADASVFLGLGPRLGEAVDAGQVSTALLVHWPGHECFAYEDIRRASQWGLALGKFQTLGEYFEESERPYHNFEPSSGSGTSDPIGRSVQAGHDNSLSQFLESARDAATDESTTNLRCFAALLNGKNTDREGSMSTQAAARELGTAFGFSISSDEKNSSDAALVINGDGSAARTHVALGGNPPPAGGQVYSSHQNDRGGIAIVDAPGYGFTQVCSSSKPLKQKWFSRPKPLAGESFLRNDFFEATVHPGTGGILSVHTMDARANRFSMQLVYHRPGADDQASRMEITEQKVICSDPIQGQVQCIGRLLDADDQAVANYTITYGLEFGSRLLHAQVAIEPLVELGDNPWQNYFAARIAWALESSVPKKIVRDQLRITSDRQLLSPQGVFIDEAGPSTLVLGGGLPAHRRVGRRMLDTLLLVKGESRREFDLAYGFDVTNPVAACHAHFTPPVVLALEKAGPAETGWLFHIDSPSVIAGDWQVCDETATSVSLRLCETWGKSSRVRLRCYRNIASAEIVDMLGNKLRTLEPENDSVMLNLSGHQIVKLHLTLES